MLNLRIKPRYRMPLYPTARQRDVHWEDAPGYARSLLGPAAVLRGFFFGDRAARAHHCFGPISGSEGSHVVLGSEGARTAKRHCHKGCQGDAMTEIRRVKMKFGDAEFEADVPEDRVQPMYDRFIGTMQRRCRIHFGPIGGNIGTPANAAYPAISADTVERLVAPPEFIDDGSLRRLFDLHEDGLVILKVLPNGAGQRPESLLLILYGYRRLKNEDGVLATQLHRAAERSGVAIRWPAYELAPYDRFVNRAGRRKGSTYSLNEQGLAIAQKISTNILGAGSISGQPPILE